MCCAIPLYRAHVKIGAQKVFNSEDEFRIIPNKPALRSLILM